jgi:hypothetical protein
MDRRTRYRAIRDAPEGCRKRIQDATEEIRANGDAVIEQVIRALAMSKSSLR